MSKEHVKRFEALVESFKDMEADVLREGYARAIMDAEALTHRFKFERLSEACHGVEIAMKWLEGEDRKILNRILFKLNSERKKYQ